MVWRRLPLPKVGSRHFAGIKLARRVELHTRISDISKLIIKYFASPLFYLLRGVPVIRPNQMWSTDITYIRLARGFEYLVAIIDWYSRKVLSWRISNSMDASSAWTAAGMTPCAAMDGRKCSTTIRVRRSPARLSPTCSCAKAWPLGMGAAESWTRSLSSDCGET